MSSMDFNKSCTTPSISLILDFFFSRTHFVRGVVSRYLEEIFMVVMLGEGGEREDIGTISATEARCSIPKREGLPRREIICKLFVSQLSFCVVLFDYKLEELIDEGK